MLADQVDAVIGVDTHHDTHTPSVVTPLGAERAHLQLDALSAADCLKVYMTRLSSTRAQRMYNARQVTMAEIALSCGVPPDDDLPPHPHRSRPRPRHASGLPVERSAVACCGRPRGRRVAPAALSASRTKP